MRLLRPRQGPRRGRGRRHGQGQDHDRRRLHARRLPEDGLRIHAGRQEDRRRRLLLHHDLPGRRLVLLVRGRRLERPRGRPVQHRRGGRLRKRDADQQGVQGRAMVQNPRPRRPEAHRGVDRRREGGRSGHDGSQDLDPRGVQRLQAVRDRDVSDDRGGSQRPRPAAERRRQEGDRGDETGEEGLSEAPPRSRDVALAEGDQRLRRREELRAGLEADADGRQVEVGKDPVVEAGPVVGPVQENVVIGLELVGAELRRLQERQRHALPAQRRQGATQPATSAAAPVRFSTSR